MNIKTFLFYTYREIIEDILSIIWRYLIIYIDVISNSLIDTWLTLHNSVFVFAHYNFRAPITQ